MKEGLPSATAQSAAIRRAEHQFFDWPQVFSDPIAPWLIAPEAWVARWPFAAQLADARYLRAFVAVRSRYAEDQVARAIAAGARQYVILGAGLDTFAYRNPYPPEDLHVFEVDHPDTQALKRASGEVRDTSSLLRDLRSGRFRAAAIACRAGGAADSGRRSPPSSPGWAARRMSKGKR